MPGKAAGGNDDRTGMIVPLPIARADDRCGRLHHIEELERDVVAAVVARLGDVARKLMLAALEMLENQPVRGEVEVPGQEHPDGPEIEAQENAVPVRRLG